MKQKLVSAKNVVRDVDLVVSGPRRTRLGKSMELVIVLMNKGKDEVFWGKINGYRDCQIRVFDSRNNPVSLTPFGEQVMGGEPEEYKKYIKMPLAPGESHTWRIDLFKLFELKVGQYSVSVSTKLNEPDSFKVAIENLRFKIVN